MLHRHLGDMGYIINKTLSLLGNEKVKKCDCFLNCQVFKSVKSKICPVEKHSGRVSERPLTLVHMDVVGPYPKKSFREKVWAHNC